MINNHIILQSHLIYFRKTCYRVGNFKKKIKPSPPKPSIQTHPKRTSRGDLNQHVECKSGPALLDQPLGANDLLVYSWGALLFWS